jgi:uncharacterized protein involved in exopolysaccharide biosynthesis
MAKNSEVGPRDYWRALMRRKWLIAASVAAWVVLALGLNAVTDPVYRAKTQVVIEKEPTRSVLTGELLESSTSQSDNLALFTAAALIDNRALLAGVVETLNAGGVMLHDPPSKNPLQPALAALRKRGGGGRQTAAVGEHAELKRRIDWLESKISVEPVRNTRLVNIYVEHSIPSQAEKIADAVAAAFVKHQASQVSSGTTSLVHYLSAQLEQVKTKIEGTESHLSRPNQTGYFALEARLNQLTQSTGELRRDLMRSDAELAKARQVYRQEHPKLVVLESEHRTIEENLASGEREMREINGKMQQYSTLQADLKSNKDLYNLLQVKLQEAQLNAQREQPLVQVVEPAAAEPGMVRPRKTLNLAIGVVIGLMFGVGLAFLKDTFRHTIRTPHDVEEQLELPVLGLIPKGA